MRILLFGITNVGKSTIGKILSRKMNYCYDDLDEEIKRRYKTIKCFQEKYPDDYERHRKRGDILLEILDKHEDNVVIVVSPIYYKEHLKNALVKENVIAIEIQDSPENILKRLVYADDDDNIYSLEVKNEYEKEYYLNDIKEDIRYYKREYKIINNKFNINGEEPNLAADRLVKYIGDLN